MVEMGRIANRIVPASCKRVTSQQTPRCHESAAQQSESLDSFQGEL